MAIEIKRIGGFVHALARPCKAVIEPIMQSFFMTGTDTNVGKSVAAAWAMLHLNADYWKPVQSGLEDGGDIAVVKAITGLPEERFLAPRFTLTQPLSPHEAAKRDGVSISLSDFTLPQSSRPLIVEGAGGVMVPLNEKDFVIDLIRHLGCPAILVCRSQLGTINHTLLSLEALRSRGIPVAGLILSGPKTPHNRQALEEYGHVPILAELDHMPLITCDVLASIKPAFDLLLQKAAA